MQLYDLLADLRCFAGRFEKPGLSESGKGTCFVSRSGKCGDPQNSAGDDDGFAGELVDGFQKKDAALAGGVLGIESKIISLRFRASDRLPSSQRCLRTCA